MTQLSPHFSLAEFTRSDAAKRLGDANQPTAAHLANLRLLAAGMERVRAIFSAPITITSAYRNPRVNRAVGGVPNSHHALGLAADFRVGSIPPFNAGRQIAESSLRFDQLILETSRNILHISFAPAMRRQLLTQRGGAGTPFEQGIVR